MPIWKLLQSQFWNLIRDPHNVQLKDAKTTQSCGRMLSLSDESVSTPNRFIGKISGEQLRNFLFKPMIYLID